MDEALIRFRGELHRSAERRIQRRRRRAVLALAAIGALIVSGGAIGATQLLGSPAPPAVVHDFASYTVQLGFHPRVGEAVLVARDGDVALYATGNDEGTACVTIAAPWKRDGEGDGGTCVRRADAALPILAGVVGFSPAPTPPLTIVAGRVTTPGAVSVRFENAVGELVVRPLELGGYFVASVAGPPCAPRDWAPSFTALAGDGHALAAATIPLVRVMSDACGAGMGLHR